MNNVPMYQCDNVPIGCAMIRKVMGRAMLRKAMGILAHWHIATLFLLFLLLTGWEAVFIMQ